jgi:hypothetical protein
VRTKTRQRAATGPTGSVSEREEPPDYNVQATILHLLGFEDEKLTYRHAGRDFRLTDVHGQVVNDLFA